MGSIGVGQRTARLDRVGGPAFDLVASKLVRPVVRPGTVGRWALMERLAGGEARPIVSVAAPAGYGKTTLLSQWAEREGHSFVWVSVDEGDNDPKVLLTYIAAALDAVEPIGRRVFDALASPASSVPGSVVLRLSRNTIKSEAISIYRKLGTPSRSRAVARARELGLLER